MRFNETGIKRIIISLTLALVLGLLVAFAVSEACFAANDIGAKADESANKNQGVVNGAVEIINYDFKALVKKNHSYDVVEKITVNLPNDTQSINFQIPSGNFRISDIRVENTAYEEVKSETANSITIRDEKKLKKGRHVYTIEYTIREFADRDENKDMFYFDVLLPSWEQPISKININLSFPSDFPFDDMQYYAGQFGVQNVNTKMNYSADSVNKTVHITGSKIPENFGISVKAKLPNGYWQGALDGIWALRAMLIVLFATLAILFLMWLIGGRDPKRIRRLQDHPVEGVNPVEIGFIFSGRVHTRDIICWLVYMATKGYLNISEYEPKKYNLIRKKDPAHDEEEKFIRNAYEILFEDIPVNRGVDMDELGTRLRRIKNSIGSDIASGFSSPDMVAYKPLSKVFRILGAVLYGLAMGIACALRYSYEYLSIDYFESACIAIAATATALLISWIRDRQYFSEDKVYNFELSLAAVAFLLVPAYISFRTIRLTGQYLASLAVLLISIICGYLIIIMRARAKGNAELTYRFMDMRHFIYHPTPKEVVKNYIEDKNYYYEMLPYALLFNGLETWSISFLSLKVEAPEWYSDDIEGHAHSNIRTEITVLEVAKDVKAFYRTMIDAYQTMVRRHRKG